MFTGGLVWAPYGLQNVLPLLPVAWFFNVYVKRRYLAWWSKVCGLVTVVRAPAHLPSFFLVQLYPHLRSYLRHRHLGDCHVLCVSGRCLYCICDSNISLSLNFHGIELDWVGNTKPWDGDNCDYKKCPRLKVDPAVGHFGPGVGEFD